jgi:hypothetical protein
MGKETDPEAIATETRRSYRLNSGVVIELIERERRVRSEELPPGYFGMEGQQGRGRPPKLTAITRSVAITAGPSQELDTTDTLILLGMVRQWMHGPLEARPYPGLVGQQFGMIGE